MQFREMILAKRMEGMLLSKQGRRLLVKSCAGSPEMLVGRISAKEQYSRHWSYWKVKIESIRLVEGDGLGCIDVVCHTDFYCYIYADVLFCLSRVSLLVFNLFFAGLTLDLIVSIHHLFCRHRIMYMFGTQNQKIITPYTHRQATRFTRLRIRYVCDGIWGLNEIPVAFCSPISRIRRFRSLTRHL